MAPSVKSLRSQRSSELRSRHPSLERGFSLQKHPKEIVGALGVEVKGEILWKNTEEVCSEYDGDERVSLLVATRTS